MASEKGYNNIKFIRIMNLLGLTGNVDMSRDEYLSNTDSARKMLVKRYLDPGFDVREAIKNADINLTYCGYLLFLSKDLR
jgi:hypothetical protein